MQMILNGQQTIAPCVECGEDAAIRHGKSKDNGAPMHDIECPTCGGYFVYVGYYCQHCMNVLDTDEKKAERSVMRYTTLQYNILKYLRESGPTRNISAIAGAIGSLRPSVSRSIHLLETGGLVEHNDGCWCITNSGEDRIAVYNKNMITVHGYKKATGLHYHYYESAVSFDCCCGREELFLSDGGDTVACDGCGREYLLVNLVAVRSVTDATTKER